MSLTRTATVAATIPVHFALQLGGDGLSAMGGAAGIATAS